MPGKIKVLILGSTGLIGHNVYDYLSKKKEIKLFNLSKSKLNTSTEILNVKHKNPLFKYIESIKPNYIINAIGLLIEDSEKFPLDAIKINSLHPQNLNEYCTNNHIKLIHISTDCVFSGYKKNKYLENDIKDGSSIYSKTKSLGEFKSNSNLIIRTSVVGPELSFSGNELFNWYMMQNKNIKGYKNAIWSGVTTCELSKFIYWNINKNISGIYHLTNNKEISKYELLLIFNNFFNKKVKIIPYENKFNSKSFLDTRKEINYKIPSYYEMINQMSNYIFKNKSIYKHYFST